MAIPGVFTPVNFDNWLLVDGGALNNIPADVTKKMGADTVIAVNVGADSATEAQTRASLVSLLGRTIDTMMTTSIRQALKDADIIIDPDLIGLGVGRLAPQRRSGRTRLRRRGGDEGQAAAAGDGSGHVRRLPGRAAVAPPRRLDGGRPSSSP